MEHEISQQHWFWVCDGSVLKNLQELKSSLQKMSENTYKYHANESKNDFANWVNDIIKNPQLTLKLKKAKSRQDAAKEVARVLKERRGK